MWGTKSQITKQSDFFKGVNIFQIMQESTFGKMKQSLIELFSAQQLDHYKLPTVIVIGDESTGKSSLLENITKCQLFPRDSKLCTKCPIHIKLINGPKKYKISYYENNKLIELIIKDKNDIYKIVESYMQKLNDIIEKEIIIEISDIDIVSFELLDLPGIRSFPVDSQIITTKLYKKYLCDKNSIVLCVVPATTTRLTSCQSIALVSEMKMEKNCILALTMTDRLQTENIEDLLIKRILNMTDELDGLCFASCVAVVNRTNNNIYSLEENDINEVKWFETNILNGIPNDYMQYEKQIMENITIINLIKKMNELYSEFMKTEWKPRILSQITNKMEKIKLKYKNLGPEDLDIVKINMCLTQFSHDMFNNICGTFSGHIFKISDLFKPSRPIDKPIINNHISLPTISEKIKIIAQRCETFKFKNEEIKENDFHDMLPDIDVEDVPIENNYYSLIQYIDLLCAKYKNIDMTFIEQKIRSFFKDDTLIVLSRFEKIESIFMSDLMNNYNRNIINIDSISNICKTDLLNKYISDNITCDAKSYYDKMIFKLYKLYVLYPMLWINVNYDEVNYVESENHTIKRQKILEEYLEIQKHYNNIMSIC